MEITDILKRALDLGASDIFVVAGLPLTYKVSGRQRREGEPLMPEDTGAVVEAIYALCGRNMARVAAGDADDDYTPLTSVHYGTGGSSRSLAVSFSTGTRGFVLTGQSGNSYFDDVYELLPYELEDD